MNKWKNRNGKNYIERRREEEKTIKKERERRCRYIKNLENRDIL